MRSVKLLMIAAFIDQVEKQDKEPLEQLHAGFVLHKFEQRLSYHVIKV